MKLRKVLTAVFFAAVMIMSLSVTVSAAEKTRSANKDDIIGKWYYVDGRGSLYFYKSGKLKITFDGESDTCKYTVKNGLLKLDIGADSASCAAVINDGVLEIIPLGDGKFTPYKSGQSLNEYYYGILECEYTPLILSKKKPVPAEHEDVLGTWVVTLRSVDSKELSLIVFSKNGTLILPYADSNKPQPEFLKNGKLVGDRIEAGTYDDDTIYVCGKNMYATIPDVGIMVFEPYKAKKLTKKALESAIEKEKIIFYYKNGEMNTAEGKTTVSALTDKSVTLKLDGEKIKFKYYCTDNCIYCVNENASVVLERK